MWNRKDLLVLDFYKALVGSRNYGKEHILSLYPEDIDRILASHLGLPLEEEQSIKLIERNGKLRLFRRAPVGSSRTTKCGI